LKEVLLRPGEAIKAIKVWYPSVSRAIGMDP
jgi:hypothetical protein